MYKITSALCFIIISQFVYSQNLITDNGTILRRGIYKSYKEFKTNSPSIPLEYEVKSGIVSYNTIIGAIAYSNLDTFYVLTIGKDKAKETGTVWGFCDGTNAYINREFNPFNGKIVFKPESKFYKILNIGRYCYFMSAFPQTPIIYTHLDCAIDFNSGDLLEINKKRLKKIISKDQELLNELDNEDDSKSSFWQIYLKYIKAYSEKHMDEIVGK
jgi:hypothetical protein